MKTMMSNFKINLIDKFCYISYQLLFQIAFVKWITLISRSADKFKMIQMSISRSSKVKRNMKILYLIFVIIIY